MFVFRLKLPAKKPWGQKPKLQPKTQDRAFRPKLPAKEETQIGMGTPKLKLTGPITCFGQNLHHADEEICRMCSQER